MACSQARLVRAKIREKDRTYVLEYAALLYNIGPEFEVDRSHGIEDSLQTVFSVSHLHIKQQKQSNLGRFSYGRS